jgi:hypothetical protein
MGEPEGPELADLRARFEESYRNLLLLQSQIEDEKARAEALS